MTAIQQTPVLLPPAAADRAAGVRSKSKYKRPSITNRSEQSIYPTQKSVLRTEATPVYMCPAQGGAYTHGRARFFGMYRNKNVELIAEIQALVDVDLQGNTTSLKWKNVEGKDVDFANRALSKVREYRSTDGPTRVFLLGPLFGTAFRKDSAGGMQSSKRYFNISDLKAQDAEDLAQRLKDRLWSEFVPK